jgi:hypothetical protein
MSADAPAERHPDAERIAMVLILGRLPKTDQAWSEHVGQIVDVQSVMRAASERAVELLGRMSARADLNDIDVVGPTVMAAWCDGFVTGAKFQAEGGHRQPTG